MEVNVCVGVVENEGMTYACDISHCLRKRTVLRNFICLINERHKMPQSACICKKIRNTEYKKNEGSNLMHIMVPWDVRLTGLCRQCRTEHTDGMRHFAKRLFRDNTKVQVEGKANVKQSHYKPEQAQRVPGG